MRLRAEESKLPPTLGESLARANTTMKTTYYHKTTSGDQGSVIDEQTGRTVAIVYDAKDAPLLAAAPALRDALQRLSDAAYSLINAENVTPDLMDELKQAMLQSYTPLTSAPYTE
jgi:hypothetical protein